MLPWEPSGKFSKLSFKFQRSPVSAFLSRKKNSFGAFLPGSLNSLSGHGLGICSDECTHAAAAAATICWIPR